ncbi:DnaJ domain containing protein, putative [Babesia bigemina]|uniref:DnaJ domain containing protein, putative n=1 Tax=Babesia bigemina TaxID=5866 RepID=A0A061CYK2_BABBI|nr:DnaJ domain containing protein, putative [Babesia bigemina]CDR93721.1 DnaJ domain containing protein, putative [Babesia bigemina]|eukprot:XP_012765907.1 DnaJ domain containing protein, putative [Babesia bigemina]
MPVKAKRKLLRGGGRRLSQDSDDETLEERFNAASPSATTADSIDSDAPSMKRAATARHKVRFSPRLMSAKFLESFITHFSPEELAAKRTVETIYKSSSSFSYTYHSLQQSLFSGKFDSAALLSFFKALSVVADEQVLRSLLSSNTARANVDKAKPSPVASSTLRNYEVLLVGAVKKLQEVLVVDHSATGWRMLMSCLRCLVLDGLLPEMRSLFKMLFGDSELGYEKLRKYLEQLKGMVKSLDFDIPPATDKAKRRCVVDGNPNVAECLGVVDQIAEILSYLRGVFRNVTTAVANRPESEGLESLLQAAESHLVAPQGKSVDSGAHSSPSNSRAAHVDGSAQEAAGAASEDDGVNVDFKVECLRLLLSVDCCSSLGDVDLPDSGFIREKFEHICTVFDENRRRQREQQAEMAKKSKLKRDAVSYVLARVAESESASAPPGIRHPFYILGIPPSRCSEEVLRKCGRKLKTLLHPDTEHDAEWKAMAERAFKEASLALEKCAAMGGAIHNSVGLRMGTQPPFAAFIGLVAASSGDEEPSSTAAAAAQSSANVLVAPSLVLMPSFTLSCMDSKAGSIAVSLDPSLYSMSGFSKLGKNKHLVVYMHRPMHGDEPSSFRVHPTCVFDVRRVAVPESSHGKQICVKMDAVQPIVFGSAWRYFVGVQLEGDLGSSLVTWRGVYVELATKGRTSSHVCKLLNTYVGAPFVNQSALRSHMERCREGVKADAELFLHECARSAQRWADGQ